MYRSSRLRLEPTDEGEDPGKRKLEAFPVSWGSSLSWEWPMSVSSEMRARVRTSCGFEEREASCGCCHRLPGCENELRKSVRTRMS
ncbi:hypothetical protein CDL15_Pgr017496 [Punica granatum]|uniref:Uncharacterized protein n=1 Tax=Punica granatum TaxID=22663 RepID=A0A218WYB9_PUNGR|nr:hypothetical protein CDL15_Pgr017496 [Punica granatum]PKI70275.1 hypothetical protein CRG98_009352 [Punica granatum]